MSSIKFQPKSDTSNLVCSSATKKLVAMGLVAATTVGGTNFVDFRHKNIASAQTPEELARIEQVLDEAYTYDLQLGVSEDKAQANRKRDRQRLMDNQLGVDGFEAFIREEARRLADDETVDAEGNRENEAMPTLNLPLPEGNEIIRVNGGSEDETCVFVIPTKYGHLLYTVNSRLTILGQRDVVTCGSEVHVRPGLPLLINGFSVPMEESVSFFSWGLTTVTSMGAEPFYCKHVPFPQIPWTYGHDGDEEYRSHFGLTYEFLYNLSEISCNSSSEQTWETHDGNRILFVNYPGRINIGDGLININWFDTYFDVRTVDSNGIDTFAAGSRVFIKEGRSAALWPDTTLYPLNRHGVGIPIQGTIARTLGSFAEKLLQKVNDLARANARQARQIENRRMLHRTDGIMTAGPDVPVVHSMSSCVNQIEGTGTTTFD